MYRESITSNIDDKIPCLFAGDSKKKITSSMNITVALGVNFIIKANTYAHVNDMKIAWKKV